MEILYYTIVLAHILSFGLSFAGFYSQRHIKPKAVHINMLQGAIASLVTGLTLVFTRSVFLIDPAPLDGTKVLIKLSVSSILLIFCLVYRKRTIPEWLFTLAQFLLIVNVAVAVMWR